VYSRLIGKTLEEAEQACSCFDKSIKVIELKTYRYYRYDSKRVVRAREVDGKIELTVSDFMLEADKANL